MKKVLFAVALVMGLGSSVAFAGNMVSDVEIVVMVNDYKPIEVKDLPQAVQDTIKKDFADLTIKEAAVEESEEGTKTYKVTFTDVRRHGQRSVLQREGRSPEIKQMNSKKRIQLNCVSKINILLLC